MRFNHRELAMYALSRQGKADREGCLWMKETDSRKRKKDAFIQRWFELTGNMLFYWRSENPRESTIVGLVILERCRVENDPESGNRNSFKLVFEDSDIGYSFLANSGKDQDEWTTALNSGSYEYLRLTFSELRGQLMHLTGKDPLVEDHPLGTLPIKTVSPVPASSRVYEGEPMFELSLACSSLVGNLRDCVPSSLIVTSSMTPPQAYWLRYAQTEVIEHNCDPRFFTTVVFYKGSVSMATHLKFEVFDVYDRKESKMCPIGLAQSKVMELIRSPNQSQRLDITFDGGTCGYLHIKAWKSQDSESAAAVYQLGTAATRPRPPELGTPPSSSSYSEAITNFTYTSPMDNIVIRNFLFPVSGSEEMLKVTEVMGEGRYSFSIPMQILDMYISEENHLLAQYHSLTGLHEQWEIAKQEVMIEHQTMVSQYRESRSGLQAQLEAGMTFKKSTSKGVAELDFVPVNLHIQEMRVTKESATPKEKDKVMYTAITCGCPSAFSHKYHKGGLAKLQVASPIANMGAFSPSAENKAFRAQSLLSRVDSIEVSVKVETQRLLEAARQGQLELLHTALKVVSERVNQLHGHCNVTLVNDALKTWQQALTEPHAEFPSVAECTAGALCQKVKEFLYTLEQRVGSLVATEQAWAGEISEPVKDLLASLDVVTAILKKGLYFFLLKESYGLMMEKTPIGMKGYKHRRDIVFSQAVSTAVTSFYLRFLQSVALNSFLSQLIEVGFLVHWESLLSTQGDEMGMLEDFMVAIHDLNNLRFKLTLAESIGEVAKVCGSRYKVLIEVPVQKTLFRLLPAQLQEGKEIAVVAVFFTQGVNEQQSIADAFGDSSLQDQINMRSLQHLTSYCTRYKERFGSANAKLSKRCGKVFQLLELLRTQVHAKRSKNVEILSISQELCRSLDCGRVTSCKSGKDRTGMSVTLEQANILVKELDMDPQCFQQAIDAMRSQGTRIRNAEKNIGIAQFAFNALQVYTLPPLYRPPEGTYKKLTT